MLEKRRAAGSSKVQLTTAGNEISNIGESRCSKRAKSERIISEYQIFASHSIRLVAGKSFAWAKRYGQNLYCNEKRAAANSSRVQPTTAENETPESRF